MRLGGFSTDEDGDGQADGESTAVAGPGTIRETEEALGLYRRRDWVAGAQKFEAAAEADPGDLIPKLYLERIAHFHQNPPPDDWDGVWTMTFK